MKGIIFNINRFAVHDGPGIRTTVFMKGCPLRCFWCHNPESWSSGVQTFQRKNTLDGIEYCEDELIGREMSVVDLMKAVEKERLVMEESGGGVTFSGGEPLLQASFLREALISCRSAGLHTAVDTSGYAETQVLESITDFTSLFLFDLKIMDEELHQVYTGVSNRQILENLKWLAGQDKPVIIRVPLIDKISATERNLSEMVRFLSGLEKPVERIDLLPFHRLGKSKFRRLNLQGTAGQDISAPDGDRLNEILVYFRREGFNAHLS
ncbi:MAG: glycyl-radical enzyme activating protein [Bacteroidota bacterium]